MEKLTSQEIRNRFFEYFSKQQHAQIPSASVIPDNDPTLLFVNSGMYPLVPFLMGEKHARGTRLVNIQKCIRTIDIEEVGDNSHLTFFEMMGFWSLGDYFKKETIEWTYDFFTHAEYGLGLDATRLYITCYSGDGDVPQDTEAAEIWKKVGVPENRIFFLGKEDNWWDLPSDTGPCGPDTEIFYDYSGDLGDCSKQEFLAACDAGYVVEIGNDVFMQYAKDGSGGIKQLEQKNVDVGWGFERLVTAVQQVQNVFETDLFIPLFQTITDCTESACDSEEEQRSVRIIADHIRTAVIIIGDPNGVGPSNVDQGYIVRRLLRRSIREARSIGIMQEWTALVAEQVIELYQEAYPELNKNRDFIIGECVKEEKKFGKTLDKGLQEFEKLYAKDNSCISDVDAFQLFATYGFPLEMTVEIARERGMKVDESGFKKEFKKHQELSRCGASQKFTGGLADYSAESTKYHTATHLLHRALKNVLGEEVQQKGSNITPERLRFDFNYPEKLTDEQKQAVEEMINEQIQKDLAVTCMEVSVEQAKEMGALAYFEEKYDSLEGKVKVYRVGDEENPFSLEICGGPHVDHLLELGKFSISSEKSSSAGVRRIKAVLQ